MKQKLCKIKNNVCLWKHLAGKAFFFPTKIIIIKNLNKARIGNDNSVFEQLPSKRSLLFCSSSEGDGGGKVWREAVGSDKESRRHS